ncbi:hypothetical protein LJR098_000831 [Rhizobium sp. LjRoot98]|uniref:hypothetical protein n=1 Tax=Rhizobium sp. LjRoot98 TaxID=3342345 RepID=UPI003ECC8447
MRQIAAYGKFRFHNEIDHRVVYHQIGLVWQWRLLLSAWERFEKIQILQDDDGFTDIWNVVLRGSHIERFYIEDIDIGDDTATALFAHPKALRELVACCRELQWIMDSDAAGTFRGDAAPRMLEPHEEKNVHELNRMVLRAEDERIVRLPRRVS